jgi:hypothetical protein
MKEEFPLNLLKQEKFKEESDTISDLREFHSLVKIKKEASIIKTESEVYQNYQNYEDFEVSHDSEVFEEISTESFYNFQMEEKLESTGVIVFYCYFVAQTIEIALKKEVGNKILSLSGGWIGNGTKVLWEIIRDQLDRRPRDRDRHRNRNRYEDDDGYSFPSIPLPFPPLVIALTVFYIIKKYGPDLEKVPVDLVKKTFESKEDKRKRENAEAWQKFWKEWADFFLAIYRFFLSNPQYLPLIPVFFFILRTQGGKIFGSVKSYGDFSKAVNTTFVEGFKHSKYALEVLGKYTTYAFKTLDEMHKKKDQEHESVQEELKTEQKNHQKEIKNHNETKLKMEEIKSNVKICEVDKSKCYNEKDDCLTQLKYYYDYNKHILQDIEHYNVKIEDNNQKLKVDKDKKFVDGPPTKK